MRNQAVSSGSSPSAAPSSPESNGRIYWWRWRSGCRQVYAVSLWLVLCLGSTACAFLPMRHAVVSRQRPPFKIVDSETTTTSSVRRNVLLSAVVASSSADGDELHAASISIAAGADQGVSSLSDLSNATTTDADAVSSSPNKSKTTTNYHWTRQSLAIALPALVGMLADPLLSLMDTAYVGRLGSPLELAALGSGTSIFHLCFNAFRSTTAATTSLVATALQDEKNAKQQAQSVTWKSMQLGLFLGVGLMAVLLLGGNALLHAMGVNRFTSPLYPAAASYLFVRCWAAPAVLFIGVSEGAFRGYGNTVVPLIASLTAALINLVLDPLLMVRPIRWGVAGAAAATAVSQFGAAGVYLWYLLKKQMLPIRRRQRRGQGKRPKAAAAATITASTEPAIQPSVSPPSNKLATEAANTIASKPLQPSPPAKDSRNSSSSSSVFRTILGANGALLAKQGSLLIGWAFASRRATQLGPAHVAAHQVGLSVWLVFALILDGTAVSAQVLLSRARAQRDKPQVDSLLRYMLQYAFWQGVLSMSILYGLNVFVPSVFTTDPTIRRHLQQLLPHVAWQQVLVSFTLIVEMLAVGFQEFKVLATGTALATLFAMWQISQQMSVATIWSVGVVALFGGRCLAGTVATWRGYRKLQRQCR